MGKEIIIVGLIAVALGIWIYIKTGEWIPASIPTIIGFILVLFYKEEDKIEKRKDIKHKPRKK